MSTCTKAPRYVSDVVLSICVPLFFRRVWVNRFCILFFSSPFSVLFLNAIVAAAAVFSLRIILFAYASDVDVQCGVWCDMVHCDISAKKADDGKIKNSLFVLKVSKWSDGRGTKIWEQERERESSGFCQVDGVLNCTNADRHVRVIECRQMQLSPSLSL